MFKAGGDLTEGEEEEGEGLPYKRGD
jgi:hypothetical protein